MSDLIERARTFATAAHRDVGQLRKYSGQPYEEHLRRVASMVAAVTTDAEVIAAAWLHDVIEDTPTTIEEIEREFGSGVRELVDALTDVSRPHHGNRATRKALDREHLAAAPGRAQTVKLADLIDNCQDICRHSPRFGRVFVLEMAALLDVLTAADDALRRRARKTLAKCTARLAAQRTLAAVPADAAATRTASRTPPPPGTDLKRVARTFIRAFTAADVAEPLPAFDAPGTDAPTPALPDGPVFGVRVEGRVTAYAVPSELAIRALADAMRPISRTQVLDANASLADVVLALTRHDFCFPAKGDDIAAYIGRHQMQGPVARMWLFGMITSLELAITEDIRWLGDALDWASLLSPARLAKARALQGERADLKRPVPLLDCLQFSDKLRIFLAIDDQPRPLLRGHSKAESQRLIRDLEDLRNSLAHAQNIVSHDWAQIARLAKRIEEIANE